MAAAGLWHNITPEATRQRTDARLRAGWHNHRRHRACVLSPPLRRCPAAPGWGAETVWFAASGSVARWCERPDREAAPRTPGRKQINKQTNRNESLQSLLLHSGSVSWVGQFVIFKLRNCVCATTSDDHNDSSQGPVMCLFRVFVLLCRATFHDVCGLCWFDKNLTYKCLPGSLQTRSNSLVFSSCMKWHE